MTLMTKIFAATTALTLTGTAAVAQTNWDLTTAWGANNFHAQSAIAFADAVRDATDGAVDITVHLSGETGVKITEKLAAVENGIVQMADMLLFLQAGEEPFLGVDTLPYLIQGQDEMKTWLEVAGPTYDAIFARHNQKVLYYVPWPSPGVYTKEPVVSADDMNGLRIRSFNATSFTFLEKMGAAPVELPFEELATAVAAGTVDGAATSTSTGANSKLYQFTGNFNPLNWSMSPDAVTVNLDAWNGLTDQERETIQSLADEMEADFWAASAQEDASKTAELVENGMVISTADESLKAKMAQAGKAMWAAFFLDVPEAQAVVEAYAAKTGK
ncbi:TRAP-type C4-dicarboxylate transport system substrate-binding protein [Sulfitobacter undariae]|uniref:TRAP-type C4-dicarboxylate transport system substrate-binding protein n=1 Tax=Sulfitobacter undariae TaxID=1563671 RepID=A0A7W6H1N9_9RHOB|nr:TRAP transporter substrate-binding protein [Sulfitobacter undariae]MBB3993949.1 TRAP-type C4-dicarboxylate transport system substrate-binding protein [Sulfitobacter undariae]